MKRSVDLGEGLTLEADKISTLIHERPATVIRLALRAELPVVAKHFPKSMRRLAAAISSGVLVTMLFSGCGRSPQNASKPTPASQTNPVASSETEEREAAAAAGPGKDQKSCFACKGEGIVACRAPGCRNGKVDCPGACLKLTRGTWVHMNVAGHDPKELWQEFRDSDGRGGMSWNQNHVGEVIAMQNGHPVNIGRCKICGGTTKVDCHACKGQGKQTCDICEGKKFIPIAWTPTDNPWFNKQPDVIRLKDGTALLGKVVGSSSEQWTVRLRDGKFTHVTGADVLAKPEASSPAAPK